MTELMSDQRHEELVKAAEECIDLMNIGADPNAALRHVKKAFDMNDNEVTLVSHAVNNSKQLSHLQSAKDKGAPFLMTSAEQVTGANSKADLDTKADGTETKEEQPDAVEIKDKIKKDAAAESYELKENYRKVAFDVDGAKATLTEAWGAPKPLMDVTDLGNPFDSVNALKIAAEQARTLAAGLRDEACAHLDKVAEAFVTAGGPKFADFEKAAVAGGVTPELIDIIYDLGPAALEQPRCQEKTAGDRLYVTADTMTLLKEAEAADQKWQMSADYEAARAHLLEQIAETETKLAGEAGGFVSGIASGIKDSPSVAEGLFPLDPEGVAGLSPQSPTAEVDKTGIIGYKVKQQLANSKARSELESLMQDDFVGKHSIPEVVEAYNRAISVNPKFGIAELTAMIRQDLASKNAMPVDLLIRASNAHQRAAPNAGAAE